MWSIGMPLSKSCSVNAYPGVPGRQDLGHLPGRALDGTAALPWVRRLDTKSIRRKAEGSVQTGTEKLPVKITLTLGQTSLHLAVDGEIELEWLYRRCAAVDLQHAGESFEMLHRAGGGVIPSIGSRLGEETERSERCRAGTVLVWNNRKTEVANLVKVQPLFFALVGGSPRAEGVLLNQELAVCSASILGDFYTHFLCAFAYCLFDLVYEPRNSLGMIKLHHDLLDHVGARTHPPRRSGAGDSVQQVFDRMCRILR
jgi:hypothetical protein